jgi:hypothetical protein
MVARWLPLPLLVVVLVAVVVGAERNADDAVGAGRPLHDALQVGLLLAS